MADGSSIEWTDATWNPVTGCTKISAGCDNCYAERFSERFRGVPGHPFENGFDLTLRPERLEQPLRWRQPRMIFVNSMSDLFHKDVPKEFIARVFDTMEAAHWHTFQVLTKRSSLMRDFLKQPLWHGARAGAHVVSACRSRMARKLSRVRHLQQAPAGVRFLSIEPLIGPIGELEPRRHRLGDCRRRERPAGTAHGAGVGARRSATSARPQAWRSSSSNGAACGRRRAGANWTAASGTSFRNRPHLTRSRQNKDRRHGLARGLRGPRAGLRQAYLP